MLASSGFARNERMARFLRFVVEQYLAGKDSELKESVIAMEVFGRRPDHDLTRDSIVRTEAGRLRARLSEYYAGEGKDDPLVIELPKGGYVPVFRQLRRRTVATNRRRVPGALADRSRWRDSSIALGVVVWWRVQRSTRPIGIAVLPFENLNHDAADDYLADGLTDELIRNLSAFDGLAPRSRTSSFALKGKPRNIRQAGRELAADYIVEGSVLRSGERLRINAQLVRAYDDSPVWSGKFERPASDALAIQDEISRTIVNNLRVKLGRGRRHYEASAEAYDLYLRARAAGLRNSRRTIPGSHRQGSLFCASLRGSGLIVCIQNRQHFQRCRSGTAQNARCGGEGDRIGPAVAGSAQCAGHGLCSRRAMGAVGGELSTRDRARSQPVGRVTAISRSMF